MLAFWLIYLYPLFGNTPTDQTGQRIFTLDGSNDAVLNYAQYDGVYLQNGDRIATIDM